MLSCYNGIDCCSSHCCSTDETKGRLTPATEIKIHPQPPKHSGKRKDGSKVRNNWSCSLLLLGLCWWPWMPHSEARCFSSIWRQTNESGKSCILGFLFILELVIGYLPSSFTDIPHELILLKLFRNQALLFLFMFQQTLPWVQSHDFAGRFAYAWFLRQHLFYLSRCPLVVAYVFEHKHSRHPSWAVGCLLVCWYNTDWHCETFPFSDSSVLSVDVQ